MLFLSFKVGLQIVAVALAMLATYLDYLWSDKRTRRFKTGRRILFILSFVFLFGSIVATILDETQKRQEANDALVKEITLNSQLRKVQDQNDGLQEAIALLSDKSTRLLDDQRNSFVSVLETQRQSVFDTSKTSEESTSRLDRVLQLNQREIERAGNPIRDLTISFSADLGMNNPALEGYKTRLDLAIADLMKKEEWFDSKIDLGPKAVVPYLSTRFGPDIITIEQNSGLLPDQSNEKFAYQTLNDVRVSMHVYKRALSPLQLFERYAPFTLIMIDDQGNILHRVNPDFSVPVRAIVSPQHDRISPKIELVYDRNKVAYSIVGRDILVSGPKQSRNSTISSINDLFGAQLVITLAPEYADLKRLNITMSGGISFAFNIGRECKRLPLPQRALPHYVCT